MKKAVFIFFILSFMTLGLFAQKNKNIVNDSIFFVNVTHDYGTIPQGSDGNSEFKFTNKKNIPLILSNVKASCGCTVAEWPKAPIMPGKTGAIKVKYNTNLVGTFMKSITVNSNAKNSTVMLTIKGTITAKQ
jgi:hypothetical protein